MGQICVRFKARRRSRRFYSLNGVYQAILKPCKGAVMANQAPLHSIEIIFYSSALFLTGIIGLTWYFFR